ncbi:MAG: UDP-N-acetylmuramate dehydrogenase [Candidatus Coproplasma sp.]
MLLYKSGNLRALRKESLIKQTEYKNCFSFAKNTTYGLGGVAQGAYFPENIPQAIAVYDYLGSGGKGRVILGCGSNVLASDRQFCGNVLSTKKLCGIVRLNSDTLFCLAGTTVPHVIKYCREHGLGGLEFISGIPATIGGLTYMNGGADGKFISSVVRSVKIYDGAVINLSNAECNFGIKKSAMQRRDCIILGVFLEVFPSTVAEIDDKINYYLARRGHLPKGRSCGCVFKNPPCVPAGKLIEQAGLKGKRIGGAYVSPIHANFIINDGACAGDVRKLIDCVRREVYNTFGILLEEEVRYIGDFNDFNG